MSVATQKVATNAVYGAIPSILSGTSMGAIAGSSAADEIAYATGISLKIVPANGGTIVSIRFDQDHHTVPHLYVLAEGADLGAEIGKIITMHYLKKENK